MTSGWPDPPKVGSGGDELELAKILYEAQVTAHADRLREEAERAAREHQDELERRRAAWAAEYALEKSVHDARLEVARGSIERSRAGAEFVRNAAAGIVGLYTGILGVTFATTEGATPLPAEGVVPAVFLGFALVFATAYVAFLSKAPSLPPPAPHSALRVFQESRLNRFVQWVSNFAFHRAYTLHAAVFNLAFGALFLPAPFIDWSGTALWVPAGFALAFGLLLPVKTKPTLSAR